MFVHIKNLIFVLLCLVLIGAGLHISGVWLRPQNTDNCVTAIRAFHSLPQDSVDAIVFGSSHAWKGVDARAMQEVSGLSCYNYATNWQKLNTTYLFMQDAFKTQSPKIVFLESYLIYKLVEDSDLNGEIFYTKELPDDKFEYLKTCFGDDITRYVSYYVPAYAFHSKWESLSQAQFDFKIDPQPYIQSRGFEWSDNIFPGGIGYYQDFEQKEIRASSKRVLDQIYQLCMENNAKLVIFTIPYMGSYEFWEECRTYADDHKSCEYLNLFADLDDLGLDASVDFADNEHLNHTGAYKVGEYLGSFLKESLR